MRREKRNYFCCSTYRDGEDPMEGSNLLHPRLGVIPRELSKRKRRLEVETEIRVLIVLSMDELKVRLHKCIAGQAPISGEALIYLVRTAMFAADHTLLSLAFEAVCKLATASLLSHAW